MVREEVFVDYKCMIGGCELNDCVMWVWVFCVDEIQNGTVLAFAWLCGEKI